MLKYRCKGQKWNIYVHLNRWDGSNQTCIACEYDLFSFHESSWRNYVICGEKEQRYELDWIRVVIQILCYFASLLKFTLYGNKLHCCAQCDTTSGHLKHLTSVYTLTQLWNYWKIPRIVVCAFIHETKNIQNYINIILEIRIMQKW